MQRFQLNRMCHTVAGPHFSSFLETGFTDIIQIGLLVSLPDCLEFSREYHL